MVPFSHTTLWTMSKSGEFPLPLVLNPGSQHRRIAWKLSDIEAWIASRQRGIGSGPPQEVHQRRTAQAVARRGAALAAGNIREGALPNIAATARPRLLPKAERQRLGRQAT